MSNAPRPAVGQTKDKEMDKQTIDLEQLPKCPTPEQQVEILHAVSELSPDALIERLKDEDFRYLLNNCFVYWLIRTQIRALRLQRGWSQDELAERTGFKQSVISRFENIYYPTDIQIRTLRRFAEAFDVAFIVRFEDWGSFIKDLELLKAGVEAFHIASFDDDPHFKDERGEFENSQATTSDE